MRLGSAVGLGQLCLGVEVLHMTQPLTRALALLPQNIGTELGPWGVSALDVGVSGWL